MTPDRPDQTPAEDAQNGILADTGSLATSRFDILGGTTEQIAVQLPHSSEDEFADDDVVDDEVSLDAIELPTSDPGTPADLEPEEAEVAEHADVEIVDVVEIEPLETTATEVEASDDDAAAVSDLPAAFAFEQTQKHAFGDDRGIVEWDGGVSGRRADGEAQTGRVETFEAAARAAVADETLTPAAPRTGSVPATRWEAHHPDGDRLHAVERVSTRSEVTLTSKRLGEFEGGRESSDLLTPDRLLDPHQVVRPEPEGGWQHFVYSISGKRINLGDGKRARNRKELDRRIGLGLTGGARFVPVLSRKGGVGKTTVTTLLGMALADARDDRIIAIDANPDRGTLAERISKSNGKTIRDLVRLREEISGYNDFSTIVGRDETRLDVLASDADPRVSEALSDRDYHDVASLAAHYYSIVLTDTGTGIVHSVMGATLDVADELVIVAGLSVDEARLASETLTWLETNGYAERVRNAVVVLNSGRPGAPLVRPDELEAHFRSRVRAVVRMPYDPLIAAGSAITFRDLQPATRLAARELAAAVVEGLRALAPAA